MVTKRKQLKSRKRKIKLLIGFFVTILIIGGILGYIIYQMFLARAVYISPLAQGNYTKNFSDDEKMRSIEKSLRENHIEYISLSPSQDGYTILLKNGAEVIISSQKEPNKQISSLQFILSRLTMDGKTFIRLDLRYDKPVVVFK